MAPDNRSAMTVAADTVQVRYEISERSQLLVVTLFGQPTADDIKRILSETRTDSGYVHTTRLWDFRRAEFNLSTQDLQQVAAYAAMADTTPGKVAILVDQDLSYGVSRVYGSFRSTEVTQVSVFRSEPEAIAWLKAAEN